MKTIGSTIGDVQSTLRTVKMSGLFRSTSRALTIWGRQGSVAAIALLIVVSTTARSFAANGYSMPISFTNFTGRGTLTNFPALVKLNPSNTDSYSGFLDTDNGYDLRFWTNASFTGTALSYEVEAFDTNGTSYIWVKVPELTHNSAIWASWGAPAYNSQEAYTTNGAVWSEGFVGVWHLSDANDSSSNENHGTAEGGAVSTAGIIGNGHSFDGTDDRIAVPDDNSLDLTSKMTSQAWLFVDDSSGDKGFFAKEIASGSGFFVELDASEGGLRYHNWGPGDSYMPSWTVPLGEWVHFAVDFDSVAGEKAVYVNGELLEPKHSISNTDMTTNSDPFTIGYSQGSADDPHWFDGLMDEVQHASVVRSTNWIWASYMNQGANHDAFVQYGAVSQPGGISWTDTDTIDLTTSSAWAQATVSTNLTGTVLVWAETDLGPDSTNDWAPNILALGATNAGPVTAQITGLDATSDYVWRFYGENETTNGWSLPVSFTTHGPPTVDNATGPTSSSPKNATLTGMVTATNGAPLDVVRIYFGDENGGQTPGNWDTNFVITGVTEGVAFSTNVTGLLYGQRYYYTVYASNSYGVSWSTVTNFTTSSASSISIANTGTNTVTTSSAEFTGTLTGEDSLFSVYAYCGTNNNTDAQAWLDDNTATNVLVGTYTNVTDEPVSVTVSNLLPGTEYYYTLMATNAATNFWSSSNVAFRTEAAADQIIAWDDTATTPYYAATNVNVLANDDGIDIGIDVPASDATATNAIGDHAGAVSYANGIATYTPAGGFSGDALFSYVITNAVGSATGQVTVTVGAPSLSVISLTPAVSLTSTTNEFAASFTFNANEPTNVTFNFSAFGLGGSGFDLGTCSTSIGAYTFTGFSTAPTDVTVNEASKTLSFTGGTLSDGTMTIGGTGWRMISPATEGMHAVTVTVSSVSTTADVIVLPPLVIDTLSPANGATDIYPHVDLVATFNRAVTLVNGGTITVTNLTAGTASTYTLPHPSVSVVSSNNLAIAGYRPSSSTYAVTISADAVKDANGVTFAGISDTLTWRFTTVARGGGATTITASDNAYVRSGSGDQSETSFLRVENTDRLAYLRFDTTGLSVGSNDLVYLDLHCTFEGNQSAEMLKVAALNNGAAGETTWDSSLTYATRPDGTSGPTNDNTTAVVTYSGRVMQANPSTDGPRNQENPPGQVAILMDTSTFQALLADDTNDELTLILYGTFGYIDVASLGSGNFEPQLRIVRAANVESIPESIHGGELLTSGTWDDSGTTARVGNLGRNQPMANQLLVFELPEQPQGGFKADDTSFGITLESEDISEVSWGPVQGDLWAIGYVPANEIATLGADVSGFAIVADSETRAGLNLGTDNTEKVYNNLVSPYSNPGRYGIPPEGCSSLTAFINDLYANHGAAAGDYVVLRVNPEANPENEDEYNFYTGNATAESKPVLTLTKMPEGTVLISR